MKYIPKEVRIGIAGIAAICILVYGINYLKGINMFKPSSYFYVKFQNVNGLTKSRKREVVQARQIAMYLAKNHTDFSTAKIGALIGHKDHATVLLSLIHI